jgi:hypothetical protein
MQSISQTKLIVRLVTMTEFIEPFSTVTEGVASLDYFWNTNEVVYLELYLLCATIMHPYVGGWDTSLTKSECKFL